MKVAIVMFLSILAFFSQVAQAGESKFVVCAEASSVAAAAWTAKQNKQKFRVVTTGIDLPVAVIFAQAAKEGQKASDRESAYARGMKSCIESSIWSN